MALVRIAYMARPDGKWGVFTPGPPARALVAERQTLLDGLNELMKKNLLATPTPVVPAVGMGESSVSRTEADWFFARLVKLGAEEIK
jgi:hypothetical protein